jgi:hypothetical protein
VKKRKPTPVPFMICVADVDRRLTCNAICVTCPSYVCERREDERRNSPRRTRDRRILSRMH